MYVCQTITVESLDVGSSYPVSTDCGSSSYMSVVGSRPVSQHQRRSQMRVVKYRPVHVQCTACVRGKRTVWKAPFSCRSLVRRADVFYRATIRAGTDQVVSRTWRVRGWSVATLRDCSSSRMWRHCTADSSDTRRSPPDDAASCSRRPRGDSQDWRGILIPASRNAHSRWLC